MIESDRSIRAVEAKEAQEADTYTKLKGKKTQMPSIAYQGSRLRDTKPCTLSLMIRHGGLPYAWKKQRLESKDKNTVNWRAYLATVRNT
eukprot:3376557-Amphidinium_carterae.1